VTVGEGSTGGRRSETMGDRIAYQSRYRQAQKRSVNAQSRELIFLAN